METPTYVSTESHWWDASQLYGSTPERMAQLRAHEGGGWWQTRRGTGGCPSTRTPGWI